MARRKEKRLFELAIESVLSDKVPVTREHIKREVSKKLGRNVSWRTIRKYVGTLRDARKIEEIHSGKLLLYRLRR